MVCAIVHGAQLEPDTIDVIRAIAEDEDGTPKMRLETQVANYKAYLEGRINVREWESQLRVDKFWYGTHTAPWKAEKKAGISARL